MGFLLLKISRNIVTMNLLTTSNKTMHFYDLKGFTLALNHIVFVSAVFIADNQKSSQFNVRVTDDLLQFKFPNHAEAVLARGMLVKELKEAKP